MSKQDFMRRAIALSEEMMRANRGGPFGAVVIPDEFAAELHSAAEGILAAEDAIKSAAQTRPFDLTALRATRMRH